MVPAPMVFPSNPRNRDDGADTKKLAPRGNTQDKMTPGTNRMQAPLARKLPTNCETNCAIPNLLWTKPEKGIIPSIAAICTETALERPTNLSLKGINPFILPDRSFMEMHAVKLSKKPVLHEQNGSATSMIRAAADIAETESLSANAQDDMTAALVTDSLQPVIHAIRKAKKQ